MQVPDHEFVIIAARGQLLVIEAPLQATDLLLMTDKFAEVLAGGAKVPLQDVPVSAASADD